MTKLPRSVVFPWTGTTVPVRIDDDNATGEEQIAINGMEDWTPELKAALERSCFADYLKQIQAIGAQPPTVPVITRPADVWSYIQIDSVRPEGRSHVIVYAIPSWQEALHHEWCIEGADRLHYVGQFLDYPANGYHGLESSAVDYDTVIERLGHLPQSWVKQ